MLMLSLMQPIIAMECLKKSTNLQVGGCVAVFGIKDLAAENQGKGQGSDSSHKHGEDEDYFAGFGQEGCNSCAQTYCAKG